MKAVFYVEGLDQTGKGTLIDGIRQRLGFYQVIHFSRPERLQVYEGEQAEFLYQQESFRNAMVLAKSGAKLIFDRGHLGEFTYAPYRGYDGSYVFELEKSFNLDHADIRLILLYEDLTISTHFISDGLSFDDEKRAEEQQLLLQAFDRSIITDKRIITVTDRETGGFRSKEAVLEEALA